jgi:protein N-terminal amidase
MFHSPSSILPYLEPPRIGPTSLLCRKLAKKLGCCVIAGYPETLDVEASAEPSASNATAEMASLSIGQSSTGAYPESGGVGQPDMDIKGEALGVGYNSAMVVDKTGEVVGNYRKTFRFETDKNWAREGEFLYDPARGSR